MRIDITQREYREALDIVNTYRYPINGMRVYPGFSHIDAYREALEIVTDYETNDKALKSMIKRRKKEALRLIGIKEELKRIQATEKMYRDWMESE